MRGLLATMFPLASGNKDLSKEVAQQRPQQETLLCRPWLKSRPPRRASSSVVSVNILAFSLNTSVAAVVSEILY